MMSDNMQEFGKIWKKTMLLLWILGGYNQRSYNTYRSFPIWNVVVRSPILEI